MNDPTQPASNPALVPDPDARRDDERPERDEGKPGADENAAGFLKTAIGKPAKE